MSGNVWEMVSSLYRAYPYVRTDVREALNNGTDYRVLRGGSWDDDQDDARAVFRSRYYPLDRSSFSGFRVVVGGVPIESP